MKRRWRVAWVVGGLLITAIVAAWALQRRFVFPRYMVDPAPRARDDVPGLVRLEVGEVEVWFLPGAGISAERPGPAVIFAHGNAELIDSYPASLAPYRQMGISVLLPEYRGYGRSGGDPSEENITDDFVAAYDLLAARPDVDAARIVFHGRSIGGGVACALAARRPPAALILLSTFTSLPDVVGSWFPVPRFMIRDPFDNEAVLRVLERPTLILHGRHDDLVPISHAAALERAARRPTRVDYDCRHNDCPPDGPSYWADIRAFLSGAQIL